ncbi:MULTISPECIES: DUF5684 domain-containing protein [Microbacterium]|uniref:DUF5684 domain-containing protein n=1 Tax=Microbacterium TaxID=33882 RepID=UPI00278BA9D8|nr:MULTISPECIES: DUF5684 domain-containing protein [Microbacterium]MDQ1082916.1 hypothetical protein [Microbacterium sp. SORGH_AS_0344]MDQ1168316.1 hypothetical protein [Microbacterium proteolyticum]
MTDSTLVLLGMASLALIVVLYVWFALALVAMFHKMGEPAWKAWIPVVNVATILQRGEFSPWLVLLNVVPLFGAIAFAVVFIVAVHRITRAFGGGAGLTVVGALVPVVWASILGWGSAHWSGDQADERSEERVGPFRRGNDHAPASVPLVGGWTPDAATAGDASRPALSGWTPHAQGAEGASGPALSGWTPHAQGADGASGPALSAWTPQAQRPAEVSSPAGDGVTPHAQGADGASGPALSAWTPQAQRPAEVSSPAGDGVTPHAQGADGTSGPALRAWTPHPQRTTEVSSPARDGWAPDPVGGIDGSNPERREAEATPPSAPVLTPFAAPTGSLADAVPAAADWAPPGDPAPVSFPPRRRSDDDPRDGRNDSVPEGAVSDVLDALREDVRPRAAGPRRGHSLDALRAVSVPHDESVEPQTPRAGGDAALPDPGAPADGPGEASGPAPSPAFDERSRDDDPEVPSERPVTPWVPPTSRRTQRAVVEEAPAADVPLTRPSPETTPIARASVLAPGEEFPELSEAVSAVSEVPEAGTPRSARTSVSSLYSQSEVPSLSGDDDLDALDRTVVTRRKRIPWMLVPPSGTPIALTSDVVILGRRPAPDAAHPDAQLVAITDETRTVSKTHARLNLRGDTWFVTDLDSTNGVLFATVMGTDVEAPRGEEIEAGARFFLGDAEVRLARSDA